MVQSGSRVKPDMCHASCLWCIFIRRTGAFQEEHSLIPALLLQYQTGDKPSDRQNISSPGKPRSRGDSSFHQVISIILHCNGFNSAALAHVFLLSFQAKQMTSPLPFDLFNNTTCRSCGPVPQRQGGWLHKPTGLRAADGSGQNMEEEA
ncbi:hypothetical protein XENOCAPTIV_024520 [Xenoophorus captivus]|uniref:Uncharacterized protein n=1 Tax=Xenoophorus captivus TaxID=1517983 RepID=A0ABV0SD73_9TELE